MLYWSKYLDRQKWSIAWRKHVTRGSVLHVCILVAAPRSWYALAGGNVSSQITASNITTCQSLYDFPTDTVPPVYNPRPRDASLLSTMLVLLTTIRLLSILLFAVQVAYAGRYVSLPTVAQPICDDALFGSPSPDDCTAAANWIPYVTQSFRSQAGAFRVFSEPRFEDFGKVENRKYRPRAIVQLPKVWCGTAWSFFVYFWPMTRKWGKLSRLLIAQDSESGLKLCWLSKAPVSHMKSRLEVISKR